MLERSKLNESEIDKSQVEEVQERQVKQVYIVYALLAGLFLGINRFLLGVISESENEGMFFLGSPGPILFFIGFHLKNYLFDKEI